MGTKRYYAMIVYQKMISDTVHLFFPILDGLTSGKVDISLRIEKPLKHAKSIEKDWGKMQLSH